MRSVCRGVGRDTLSATPYAGGCGGCALFVEALEV